MHKARLLRCIKNKMRETFALNPVFFIGMPRSGTTILFEAFSRHPELAWPSNYSARFPRSPHVELLRALLDNRRLSLVGHKVQYGRKLLGNRYLPHPDEAYAFWNAHAGANFGRRYLSDELPDEAAVQRLRKAVLGIMRWQGRRRFSAKLTGPPRITFLSAVFPQAAFVHVVRDGRAVVHSLLRAGFWRGNGGLERPYWSGGMPSALLDRWKRSNRDPGVLAAIQWRHIVQRCRDEAASLGSSGSSGSSGSGRYLEIAYEQFVAAPEATLARVLAFTRLDYAPDIHKYLQKSARLVDMNHKYAEDFSPEYIDLLTRSMQPVLHEHGYS